MGVAFTYSYADAIMLSVIMSNVILLNAVLPNVIMLNVNAECRYAEFRGATKSSISIFFLLPILPKGILQMTL
jgi:hypothetical protein